MECPKCHSVLDDNQTVCPVCHKVLLLECPNCHTIGESAVCSKCGYTLLVKCAKCSKINSTETSTCSKCKFPTATSLAYQECETDEFASIRVHFESLRKIRKLLKSQELYSKFFYKLKNLLIAQLKGVDCKFIIYGDNFVINMCKELSFATSSAKALRLAIKILNTFVDSNSKVYDEFAVPLGLTLTITKKSSEELQKLDRIENNVKLLTVKKGSKRYLKGMQLVLDQYVCDSVNKDYKTDSLYTMEDDGQTTMFYEVLLDSYVLPPSSETEEPSMSPVAQKNIIQKSQEEEKDIYSFKVFDINAKCHFTKVTSTSFIERLLTLDFKKNDKILSIRSEENSKVDNAELVKFFAEQGYRVLNVFCTEQLNYRPWGFFEALFKEYWQLSFYSGFNDLSSLPQNAIQRFKPLFDLLYAKPAKSMTPEDGRFGYMEHWNSFLRVLGNVVIIVDGFENLDDTTLQTLELYFDKYMNIKPVFIFETTKELSVHSKIKSLLRTPCYTEFTITKTSIDACLASLKSDATDFIQSFYYEKIKEKFNGSYLYFENAIKYLEESGTLLDFEDKLIIKNNKSVVIPNSIKDLYKSRIKIFNKNTDASLMLAYLSILGGRVDFKTFETLEIKDVARNAKMLADAGLCYVNENILYLNNYNILSNVIDTGLKKNASAFLCKSILSKLGKGLDDTVAFNIMGRLGCYNEEYLTLWKNSVFALKTGDYDAYLKNCLGFLALVEHISADISEEVIEENKKEVYNNILMCLYSYSPAKIYFIENILLIDAINQGDDEKIVKLSNLMLQGALITSNYTDALGLLHNILSRMKNPTLIVDGAVNTKFLLFSLVNIEILYNIGDYRACADLANEILAVLTPEILEKVKPASFSINLFVSHLLETLRLSAFAKLFLLDDDLDEFFAKVTNSLAADLPEKECIVAIRDYLSGKVYSTGNIEAYTPFSKVVFLILQEFTALEGDYKHFAQNIYQAKLLALDVQAKELELFCDLLIAYAYSKIGVPEKAEAIYNDVLLYAENSAMFMTIALAKYLLAKLRLEMGKPEETLLAINDTLAMLQKQENQAEIIYALFEKFYIDTVREQGLTSVDLEVEEQKLSPYADKLKRLLD